jgi:hypothetical protein
VLSVEGLLVVCIKITLKNFRFSYSLGTKI